MSVDDVISEIESMMEVGLLTCDVRKIYGPDGSHDICRLLPRYCYFCESKAYVTLNDREPSSVYNS